MLTFRSFLLLIFTAIPPIFSINCYSCANDFVVWQWRHFFLKRNYALTASDAECVLRDYKPDTRHTCYSTCFIFYLNATDKVTGRTRTLGVGRGCSSQFLTDDQHLHLGLGSHSKASHVGEYLPSEFDKYDIYEHWCFCATDDCNKQSCYAAPFGDDTSYLARRIAYANSHSYWRYKHSTRLSAIIPTFAYVTILMYILHMVP